MSGNPVCRHTLNGNHWHRLLEIPAIIGVKNNITTFNHVCRFFVNMFFAVEIVLTNLNTPVWKAWGSASWAQRPLTTGIVRRKFPSLRGTMWHNNGSSTWNGCRFEHDILILTHWGRGTHICVDKLIGSDNGLSPARRQAIIWTNAGILLIGP